MQKLLLAKEHFGPVKALRKRVTIRKGFRDVKPGTLLFQTPDPEPDGSPNDSDFEEVEVVVERVVFTWAGELTDKEAQQDGFKNLADLIEGMKHYYPDFSAASEVTLIYFWPAL